MSRSATHAGSWYTEEGDQLNAELTGWLEAVNPLDESFPIKGTKAIIAPHAGYSYSGAAAAWAYKAIDTSNIKRVFILGPSHHFYLDGCAISSCEEYDTPVGALPLDIETIKVLKATGKFESLSLKADEAEHSIEMHLPYVRKIFEGQDIKVVPIVVGGISKDDEAFFGELLAPFLAREDTFCVVSSDFCHWGSRFSYTYYYPAPLPSEEPGVRLSRATLPSPTYRIFESISRLDHEAMELLTLPPSTATDAHAHFEDYLARTKNTICGRHPIGVLFGALTFLEKENSIQPTVKWVRYEQSSACHTIKDSSVSYASAWVRF